MTRRPAAVRWIVGLAWFRLVVGALAVAMAIRFIRPFESTWLEGFRQGFIQHYGHVPGSYGPEQAGDMSAEPLMTMLFSGLVLWTVSTRRLRTLQVLAVIGLLLSLPSIVGIPIALVLVVLAFQPSVARYCQPASPEAADGEDAQHQTIAEEIMPGGEAVEDRRT